MSKRLLNHRGNAEKAPGTQRKFLLFRVLCVCSLLALCLSNCQSEAELKLKKYVVVGQSLYIEHCANCHQPDGRGLEALYPPLNGSDYLRNKTAVICLIRHGQNGPIIVNGRAFNRPMPANPQLTDIDVATITTYIYNQWGGEKTITEVKDVSNVLAGCKDEK